MRKTILLLTVLALVLGLTACGGTSKKDSLPQDGASYILTAVITEIHEGYFLVDASGSGHDSMLEVPIRNMAPSPEPQVGDTIRVEYSGQILEPYPPRIAQVYSITLITENN